MMNTEDESPIYTAAVPAARRPTRRRRPHPARRARRAAGVAGVATAAVLTGFMAVGAANGATSASAGTAAASSATATAAAASTANSTVITTASTTAATTAATTATTVATGEGCDAVGSCRHDDEGQLRSSPIPDPPAIQGPGPETCLPPESRCGRAPASRFGEMGAASQLC